MEPQPNLHRRDFNRLTAAAVGGLMTGGMLGCGGGAAPPPAATPPATTAPATGEAVNYLMVEPHVCRGLNMCKGKGKGGKNDCAGLGACASVADHGCHAQNECKGQGGCGTNAGQNECKGQGACQVPLMDTAWKTARKKFEELMKAQNKTVGEAPPKPAES